MSHLEQRLDNDLNEIRKHIATMGTDVEQGLENAFAALQLADEKLAFSTILSDLPINRKMRKIDKLCHAFIAVHLPSAGHLRYLSAVIRANIILERIGDYAVTIARESIQLGTVLKDNFANELNHVSSDVRRVLHEAISAFNEINVEKAHFVIKSTIQVEENMDGIYAELMEASDNIDSHEHMIRLIIFIQLKRVADQAKNLAEEVIFVVTGEAKKPKIYKILFVDQDNSCLAPMATMIANKIVPDLGSYSFQGETVAESLDPSMVKFMQSCYFDFTGIRPMQLLSDRGTLSHYHVLVGLNHRVQSSVETIPFRTSVLNWHGNKIPEDDDKKAWEALYKQLAVQISDLMQLLRGEETL
ncbi:MAG: hypothetical protein GY808_11870 [Gammaproteobacteria bacterium]|nr:hypothetical protein [Gammaproteobacteria bacterium]